MARITDDIQFINRCGIAYRRQALEALGISHRAAILILELAENEGISQDGLARRAVLNKSNITRQLMAMEEDGLVERRACPKDKRVIRLYLTEKGHAMAPDIRQAFDGWEQMLLGHIERPEALAEATGILRKAAGAWWEENNG